MQLASFFLYVWWLANMDPLLDNLDIFFSQMSGGSSGALDTTVSLKDTLHARALKQNLIYRAHLLEVPRYHDYPD